MNSTTEAIFFKKLIIFLKILIMQVHTLIGVLQQVQGRDSKKDTGIFLFVHIFSHNSASNVGPLVRKKIVKSSLNE